MKYFVYFLTNDFNKVLYIGVTNNLERRMYEHLSGSCEGFTKKYKCKKLVYFEVFDDPENAIKREKELKGWKRNRKNELVESCNPKWQDLSQSNYQFPDKVVILSDSEGSDLTSDPSSQAPQDDRVVKRSE